MIQYLRCEGQSLLCTRDVALLGSGLSASVLARKHRNCAFAKKKSLRGKIAGLCVTLVLRGRNVTT